MNVTTPKQSKEWNDAVERVTHITDGLGMPVDKEIIETVAIMQLMGIHTTMSCAGHLQRITGGPYVMFISPEAEKIRKACQQIGDPKDAQYKKLYNKALKYNLLEQQKLYSPLEQFYAARVVPFGSRLTLRNLGFSASRLACQGAETAHLYDFQKRKQILKDNQTEMGEFTEYLRRMFFRSESSVILND